MDPWPNTGTTASVAQRQFFDEQRRLGRIDAVDLRIFADIAILTFRVMEEVPKYLIAASFGGILSIVGISTCPVWSCVVVTCVNLSDRTLLVSVFETPLTADANAFVEICTLNFGIVDIANA